MGMWFGDSGRILPPGTNIDWLSEWTPTASDWSYSGGSSTALPSAEVREAIGGFTVVMFEAAVSIDFYLIMDTTWQAMYAQSSFDTGLATPGDIQQLELGGWGGGGGFCETPVFLREVRVGIHFPPPITYHFGVIQTSAPWKFEEFNCRKKITVKKEAVTGSPTNVPVKVDYKAIDNELYWTLGNHRAGVALKMTTDDGTEIPCEAGVRNIGALHCARIFFVAPSLSSEEDTVFYLYYSSQQNVKRTFDAGDVWLPGRKGVWHDGYEMIWDGFARGIS